MKKQIPQNKLIDSLSNSRLCQLISFNKTAFTFLILESSKMVEIPVRQFYTKEYLKQLFNTNEAISMPFNIFWLYIETL
ncbi:MAG: hypothetical protein AAF611_07770 [Bacteroidota bacterium]